MKNTIIIWEQFAGTQAKEAKFTQNEEVVEPKKVVVESPESSSCSLWKTFERNGKRPNLLMNLE